MSEDKKKVSREVTSDELNSSSALAGKSSSGKTAETPDDAYEDEILELIRERKKSNTPERVVVKDDSVNNGDEIYSEFNEPEFEEPEDPVERMIRESLEAAEDSDAGDAVTETTGDEPAVDDTSAADASEDGSAEAEGSTDEIPGAEEISEADTSSEEISELEKELAEDFAKTGTERKTLKKYGFKPYTRELQAEEVKILRDAALANEQAAADPVAVKKMAKGTGKKKNTGSSGKTKTSKVDKNAKKAKTDGKSAGSAKQSKQKNSAAANKTTKTTKKAKKKPRKKWVGFVKAFVITIIIFMLAGVIAAGSYTAYVISNAPTIQPKKIYDTLDVSTRIYDDKENLVDEIYYSENRKIVSYEQLPENLKNAFIAVEDKTFWTHRGFNFKRIIGAILERFHGGRISGTSTITQQLARNVFLPEDKSVRSVKRKIIEMYYAYEIEQELSKEEIITAYLNTIYLGYGCYGVDTAAKTYFSSEVEDLTLEQCAALAALPQAPGSYALLVTEPSDYTVEYKHGVYINDSSQDRRNMILNMMLQQGLITQEEKEAAVRPLEDFIKPGSTDSATSQSAFKDYLIETVKKDLMNEYGIEEDQAIKIIYTKGLNIYTTMDTQAQKAVTKQFKKKSNFPSTANGKGTVESACVVTEIGTGEVKAMVGTRNVTGEMLFNRATNPRQPGSSIKPLSVYAPALQKSYEYQKAGKRFQFKNTGYDRQNDKGWGDYITVSSKVIDEKMTVKGKTWPLNVTRSYSGYNTFRTAIQKSINTCAVKILAQIGIDYSMETLKLFGITTAVDDPSEPTNDLNLAALGLGAMSYGISPLEMSLAYATFPNGGVRNTPICYTKVEDSSGRTLLEAKSEEVKVLDPGVAWIMTDVLKSVVTKGIAGDAKVKGIEVGGKTGTTDDRYDIWFNGFTPSYSVALWIGTDDNVRMDAMSDKAAKLWSNVVSRIDRAKEGSYKKMPDNVVRGWDGEYYTRGTVPPEPEPEPEEDKDAKDKDGKAGKDGKKTEDAGAKKPDAAATGKKPAAADKKE